MSADTVVDGLCSVCGPQPPPTVHTICHRSIYTIHGAQHESWGCGHPLADHTDGLKCRVCKHECGIDCRPMAERHVEQTRGTLFDS